MLRKLELLNYRTHSKSNLPLHPLTLFVGPAGAGKSNLFKALLLVQNTVHRSLVEVFPPGLGEFRLVRSRWCTHSEPIGFTLEMTDIPGFPTREAEARYVLTIANGPEDVLYVHEEALYARDSSNEMWTTLFERGPRTAEIKPFGVVQPTDPTILHRVRRLAESNGSSNVGFARAVAQAISRVGYYHLEASQLKRQGVGQPWDRIGYYGERLPDFIAWAKSTSEGTAVYEAILQDLRIVHGPQRPELLCLEEPETGIHPRRLRWVFEKLVELAYPKDNRRPVQVLLTSHSPYLVDCFSDLRDAVNVVEVKDGHSRVTPLPDILTHLHLENASRFVGDEWATGLYEGI
jgi:hypothetical protein